MKTMSEVQQWVEGAIAEFGDPAIPVGQIFAKFVTEPSPEQELILGAWHEKKLHIDFGGGWMPVPVDESGPTVNEAGQLAAFGIRKICPGFWSIWPSLNMPGIIHVFAHIYGVPEPAPWESMIIIPTMAMTRTIGI